MAEQLERQVTNQQLWLDRRVKIVDGTGLSMPDTAANQLQWPQNSGQKPGCGFPQLKVVGLFCLQSGALLEVAHDDNILVLLSSFVVGVDMLNVDILLTLLKRAGESGMTRNINFI
jgi:hypothetical protein